MIAVFFVGYTLFITYIKVLFIMKYENFKSLFDKTYLLTSQLVPSKQLRVKIVVSATPDLSLGRIRLILVNPFIKYKITFTTTLSWEPIYLAQSPFKHYFKNTVTGFASIDDFIVTAQDDIDPTHRANRLPCLGFPSRPDFNKSSFFGFGFGTTVMHLLASAYYSIPLISPLFLHGRLVSGDALKRIEDGDKVAQVRRDALWNRSLKGVKTPDNVSGDAVIIKSPDGEGFCSGLLRNPYYDAFLDRSSADSVIIAVIQE